MSEKKELNYFAYDPKFKLSDRFTIRTRADYEKQFESAAGFPVIGEASPAYFSESGAAARIHRLIPKIKLITSLRNPVERAYSAYLMQLRMGRTNLKVHQAFSPDQHWVKLGFYSDSLTRFYSLFPKSNIRVVLQEDLSKDSAKVMKTLFAYLEVEENFHPDVQTRHNVGTRPKLQPLQRAVRLRKSRRWPIPSYLKNALRRIEKFNQSPPDPMPESRREDLKKLYRDDIQRVQTIIDRDLSDWL